MDFSTFTELAKKTYLPEKYYQQLWRSWRFEQSGYVDNAINDFFGRVDSIKYPSELYRNGFAKDLKKYRVLRAVTKEMIADELLNMDLILNNCDIRHDKELDVIYFPLVFYNCHRCGRYVKGRESEGVWLCSCGEHLIDKFYNRQTIIDIWNSEKHRRPPREVLKEFGNKFRDKI